MFVSKSQDIFPMKIDYFEHICESDMYLINIYNHQPKIVLANICLETELVLSIWYLSQQKLTN